VPTEAPWVRLAEEELGAAGEKPAERQWGPVRQAVQHARELREQGNVKAADAVMDALRELYLGDKQAEAILKGE
jgi:hypothetical protein